MMGDWEYKGAFRNNHFHGKGKLSHRKTNTYHEGSWANGRVLGQGTQKLSDGSILIATWNLC